MNAHRWAGVLLVLSFLILIVGAGANAPGLYQTQDIAERMRILEAYRSRWYIERAASVVYALLQLTAFLLLAYSLRKTTSSWVPVLSVVAFAVATASALVFIYLQTTDPRGGYSRAYPLPEDLTYWMLLAGYLFLGISFFQGGLPAWLGYLTAAAAVVLGGIFLVTGVGGWIPFILMFLQLLIGIVLIVRWGG
jgi:hypothetical protein